MDVTRLSTPVRSPGDSYQVCASRKENQLCSIAKLMICLISASEKSAFMAIGRKAVIAGSTGIPTHPRRPSTSTSFERP